MLRNYWYVGCASCQLPHDRPVRTEIGGHQIVLFRDAERRASALADRCCHRGLPLSMGEVADGRVRCGYHGWEFDATGQCVRVPSQGNSRRIPDVYRVPCYRCEELGGYVWIWIGDEEPIEPPGAADLGLGGWVQGGRTVRCSYSRALENLFDMCHVSFVHPTHIGTTRALESGLVRTRYELRCTGSACTVFTPPSDPAQEAVPAATFRMEFRLPNMIHHVVPIRDDFFHMFFFVTPTSERSCRIDWLMTDLRQSDGAERIRWQGKGSAIGDEDQTVLELLEPAYAREGDAFECSVEADAPTLALRRILHGTARGHCPKRRFLSIMTVPRRALE